MVRLFQQTDPLEVDTQTDTIPPGFVTSIIGISTRRF